MCTNYTSELNTMWYNFIMNFNPQIPPNAPQPKEKHSRMLIVLITIFIFIVVAEYMYWQYYSSQQLSDETIGSLTQRDIEAEQALKAIKNSDNIVTEKEIAESLRIISQSNTTTTVEERNQSLEIIRNSLNK